MADELTQTGDDASKMQDPKAANAYKPQKPAKDDASKLPESVVLTSVYGFIDEAEQAFHWIEGQIETDAAKIKMLIERQAPVQVKP
jgi:hypothetical protein